MAKKIWKILFVFYLCVLLRITVFRSGWTGNDFFCGSVELMPFQTIFSYLKTGEYWYFCYLFLGNVLWFIPLGTYATVKEKKLWNCALYGFALSFFIECMQFVLNTGYSEVEDLLLNTLGAVLGGIFGLAIKNFIKNK